MVSGLQSYDTFLTSGNPKHRRIFTCSCIDSVAITMQANSQIFRSSQGEVSCSGKHRHSARRSRGSNQQPPVTSQPALRAEPHARCHQSGPKNVRHSQTSHIQNSKTNWFSHHGRLGRGFTGNAVVGKCTGCVSVKPNGKNSMNLDSFSHQFPWV